MPELDKSSILLSKHIFLNGSELEKGKPIISIFVNLVNLSRWEIATFEGLIQFIFVDVVSQLTNEIRTFQIPACVCCFIIILVNTLSDIDIDDEKCIDKHGVNRYNNQYTLGSVFFSKSFKAWHN